MGYLSTKGPATGGTSKDRLITFGRNLVLILVSVYVCNSPLFPQDPVPPFSSFLFFANLPYFRFSFSWYSFTPMGGSAVEFDASDPFLANRSLPAGQEKGKKRERGKETSVFFFPMTGFLRWSDPIITSCGCFPCPLPTVFPPKLEFRQPLRKTRQHGKGKGEERSSGCSSLNHNSVLFVFVGRVSRFGMIVKRRRG